MQLSEELLSDLTEWVEYLDSDPPIDDNERYSALKQNSPSWSSDMRGVYWKYFYELTGEPFSNSPSHDVEKTVRFAVTEAINNSSYLSR
ncbi:MAG: hypothetical protein U1B30_16590 [Pseudomonadota bacterium]|nr:hypothetical protein [Pseudomonadota bacterium]